MILTLTTTQIAIITGSFLFLVALTNLLTGMVKNLTGIKEMPTRVVAIIVAIVSTVIFFLAFAQIYSITIIWYMAVAVFVYGIVVGYVSIFGYDNVYQDFIRALKKLIGIS